MSEAVVLPRQTIESKVASAQVSPVAGVALASFSALLLELALTRLFSVVLFYHFAFLAISIALLGLGAGGVFAYLRQDWLARYGTRKIGAVLFSLAAVGPAVIPWMVGVISHSTGSLRAGLLLPLGATVILFVVHLFEW